MQRLECLLHVEGRKSPNNPPSSKEGRRIPRLTVNAPTYGSVPANLCKKQTTERASKEGKKRYIVRDSNKDKAQQEKTPERALETPGQKEVPGMYEHVERNNAEMQNYQQGRARLGGLNPTEKEHRKCNTT